MHQEARQGGQACAQPAQPQASRNWLATKFSAQRRSHLTMNSYFGVLKAAVAGIGIAALPDYVTKGYPELVNVMPDDVSEPFTIFFCYPQELRRSQRVLAFRDFMLDEVARFAREDSQDEDKNAKSTAA